MEMFRQGVTKRGEAIIAPGAKNQPASHHSAVHSILHGNGVDSSRGSSPSKLLIRMKSQNSSGSGNNSGGGRNNRSDSNYNYHQAGSSCGSDDEGSSTSLTLGSNDSWKKRSSTSKMTTMSQPPIPPVVEETTENYADRGDIQQQFPPPPRPLGNPFGEKRSFSFDVCKEEDNRNEPVIMRKKSSSKGGNSNGNDKMPLRRLSPYSANGNTDNCAETPEQTIPPPFFNRPGPPQNRWSSSDIEDRQMQHSIQRTADTRNLQSRIRSLSPRGVATSSASRINGESHSIHLQQQRYDLGQQPHFTHYNNTNENNSKLRIRSLSPMRSRSVPSSPFARGRSMGRCEKNDANQPHPEQMQQQRRRGSSLSRLGIALKRGRSRSKQGSSDSTYTSPEKVASMPHDDESDAEIQHSQASLMAVKVQPPSSPAYSPLVSMPRQVNGRSVNTHSTYSEEPLSQEDEFIAHASKEAANSLGAKKKKSRRQRIQSSVMKHLKRSSSVGSRSFGRLEKMKQRTTVVTPVTDGSSTDRSGDVPTNDNESFSNPSSRVVKLTVYEDGSNTSFHRHSSTGTASSTVSSMLPDLNVENAPTNNNLDWNPSMSLLNKMSSLQRIESFSGEEDSDYSETQDENADIGMEEIFYNPEEAYQSCSHSLFQKEMDHVEESDLSVADDDSPSRYEKGKFLYRRSVDTMVNGLKKNKKKGDFSSQESEISGMKSKKKMRSRSLSLRRMISKTSEKKEEEREAALQQAMLHSQHYQELMKQQQQQQQQQEVEEQVHQEILRQRSTDIAHNHALAALAAEAGRIHRDSTKDSNQRTFVRKNSTDPDGRKASFDSEESSFSRSSHSSGSNSRSRNRSRSRSRSQKICTVCRQKVHCKSEVKFMDFHFCLGCFQCASCRSSLCQLDADDPSLRGAQVITNTRGSFVYCGDCFMQPGQLKSEPFVPKSTPTVVSYIPTKGGASSVKYCALCKSDFSTYKGEVQCIGVNNYHSECLRREKGVLDSIGSRSLGSEDAAEILEQITPPSSIAGEELTPAGAAQDVADKAVVRITMADDDGNTETSHLSNVFFVWSQKEDDLAEFEASEQDKKMEKFLRNDGCEIDLSLQVKYKLDAMKQQDNQFLTLPQLESDSDGRINERFKVELELLDRSNFAVPHASGPVLLSIEPFPREQDSAMKVMRAAWSYECEGIQHEFRFTAPFNSPYGVAWEIFEGDELDFTSCKLECFIDRAYHETSETSPKQKRKSSRTSTSSLCDWELRADELVSEEDDEKNKTNVSTGEKIHSIDTSTKSDTTSARTSTEYSDGGGMLILHRKSHHIDPDREENDHFSELLSVASTADSHFISLPTIVHIAVKKKPNDEIGLSLIEKNGTTVVSEVSKSGLFRSKLKEGCELLSINGHRVTSPRSFIRMMKDFTGQLVIVASSSPSPPGAKFIVVKKPEQQEQQEISFRKVDGVLRVEEIKETGIFSEIDVSKGDLCLSINGVPAISENVAMRALARAQDNVALLMFPLANFWRSMVELTIDAKYDRWWKSSSECVLFVENDNSNPINLSFNHETALCTIQDDNYGQVKTMNIIIHRVMKLLKESIQSYITTPKKKRDSSRSLSVSPSGRLQNPSDVYKRALVKLDEMRESGRFSEAEYAAAKRALTENAINTAK